MKRKSARGNLMKTKFSVKFVRFEKKKLHFVIHRYLSLFLKVLKIFINQRQSMIVPLKVVYTSLHLLNFVEHDWVSVNGAMDF